MVKYMKLIFLVLLGLTTFVGSTFQSTMQVQSATLPDQVEWATIASDYYGYSFEVPSPWYKQMGVSNDRWSFLSDPAASYEGNDQDLHPPAPINGLIYIEFAADPVPNWLPVPDIRNPLIDEWGNATSDDLIPHLPDGSWITVNGVPALLVQENLDASRETHAGPFAQVTTVYILTERMVYYLSIAYAPPVVGNKAIARRDYEKIVTDILDSFTINVEAPAVWRPLSEE